MNQTIKLTCLKEKLHIFMSKFDKRWKKCNRIKNRFDEIFETLHTIFFSQVSQSLYKSYLLGEQMYFLM